MFSKALALSTANVGGILASKVFIGFMFIDLLGFHFIAFHLSLP